MKRALIAMSGGVDSSVAALLMKEAGYDCTGATMRLYRPAAFQSENPKGCCSDRDEDDAAFVSRLISSKFPATDEYIEHEISKSGYRTLCFSIQIESMTGKLVHEA